MRARDRRPADVLAQYQRLRTTLPHLGTRIRWHRNERHAFTVDTLVDHIRTQHLALDLLEQHGYAFGKRRVDILATPARTALGDRIAAAVDGDRKPLDHAYYAGGLRYMLWVTAPDGREIPLGDGGTFDWLAKLTSNRRAVYVASGLGAQLVAILFRAR